MNDQLAHRFRRLFLMSTAVAGVAVLTAMSIGYIWGSHPVGDGFLAISIGALVTGAVSMMYLAFYQMVKHYRRATGGR